MEIILLRGLGRESAHWGAFTTSLHNALAHFSEVTITCIEFPGCGELFTQHACTSIAAMTQHARQTYQAKGTGRKVILIGLSMGAMVALDWAQTYPKEIARVILINSSLGEHPWYWRLRLRALPCALAALFCPMLLRERLILRLVSNETNQSVFDENLKQWQEIQRHRPVSRRNLITMLSCARRFKAKDLCELQGLIIASQADRLVSVKCSQAIAQKFQWPIVFHNSAGHDLPMDDAEWLSGVIADWLEGMEC